MTVLPTLEFFIYSVSRKKNVGEHLSLSYFTAIIGIAIQSAQINENKIRVGQILFVTSKTVEFGKILLKVVMNINCLMTTSYKVPKNTECIAQSWLLYLSGSSSQNLPTTSNNCLPSPTAIHQSPWGSGPPSPFPSRWLPPWLPYRQWRPDCPWHTWQIERHFEIERVAVLDVNQPDNRGKKTT